MKRRIIYKKGHPNADSRGRILNARYITSLHIGRALTKEEVVHHIDLDISNDEIANLQLCENQAAHRRLHRTPPEKKPKCKICGQPQRCLGLCKKHYAAFRWAKGKDKPRKNKIKCALCRRAITENKHSRIKPQVCHGCHQRALPKKPKGKCRICGSEVRCKGLCQKHYAAFLYHNPKRSRDSA
jgi:hypothetical protein